MKLTRQVIAGLILMIVIASLYRVMPDRPLGFAPQFAMAIFAGALLKEKKYGFLLTLLSMFISDALYEILYINGLSPIPGFYQGQIVNYLLFTGLTVFGFMINKINFSKIALASIAAPSAFFLLSNFFVWISSAPDAGLNRPKTFSGLMQCYSDAIPFYLGNLAATFVFSAILFGGFYLMFRKINIKAPAGAPA